MALRARGWSYASGKLLPSDTSIGHLRAHGESFGGGGPLITWDVHRKHWKKYRPMPVGARGWQDVDGWCPVNLRSRVPAGLGPSERRMPGGRCVLWPEPNELHNAGVAYALPSTNVSSSSWSKK